MKGSAMAYSKGKTKSYGKTPTVAKSIASMTKSAKAPTPKAAPKKASMPPAKRKTR
jgi:hypothetical protein